MLMIEKIFTAQMQRRINRDDRIDRDFKKLFFILVHPVIPVNSLSNISAVKSGYF
jgi:hypothetical protein